MTDTREQLTIWNGWSHVVHAAYRTQWGGVGDPLCGTVNKSHKRRWMEVNRRVNCERCLKKLQPPSALSTTSEG